MQPELFEQAITEITHAYKIDRKSVITCLNLALLKYQHKAFPTAEYVEWIPGKGVGVYSTTGLSVLNGIGRGIKRLLIYELEELLSQSSVMQDYSKLKPEVGDLVKVRIDSLNPDKSLAVTMIRTGVFGEDVELVNGQIGRNKLSPYELEQGFYQTGRTMWVTMDSLSVINNRGMWAVKPVFSRASKKLPALLIKSKVPDVSVTCTKRVVGRISYVHSTARLEKDVIKSVNQELHERISITYGSK